MHRGGLLTSRWMRTSHSWQRSSSLSSSDSCAQRSGRSASRRKCRFVRALAWLADLLLGQAAPADHARDFLDDVETFRREFFIHCDVLVIIEGHRHRPRRGLPQGHDSTELDSKQRGKGERERESATALFARMLASAMHPRNRSAHTCPSLSGSGSFTLTRELILSCFVRFFFGLFFFGDLLCAGLRLAGLAEASASPSRSMGGNVNMPHQFPGRGPATHLSPYPSPLANGIKSQDSRPSSQERHL